MTDEREITAWSCDRSDKQLVYETMDEAVEAYLDDFGPDGEGTPDTVIAYGFSRMQVTRNECKFLDDLLERLDDEYGNPDGDWLGDKSPAMQEAEERFIDVMIEEYQPWACEVVKEVVVDTGEWIKKNRPHWIKERNKGGEAMTDLKPPSGCPLQNRLIALRSSCTVGLWVLHDDEIPDPLSEKDQLFLGSLTDFLKGRLPQEANGKRVIWRMRSIAAAMEYVLDVDDAGIVTLKEEEHEE